MIVPCTKLEMQRLNYGSTNPEFWLVNCARRSHTPRRLLTCFALDDDPESHRHTLELRELEPLHEFRQPPCCGPLYQMCVTAVQQDFRSGSRMDGKHADGRGDSLEIVKHVVDQVRLDMLEHVDTRYESAGF